MLEKEFDIVVHGATGFTGKLVAEYLAQVAPERGIRLGLSARNSEKLRSLGAGLGLPSAGLVQADSEDWNSLAKLVSRTRAVITTAGPYQINGEPLVASCADAGTDYLDLSGEVAWMRSMIDRYETRAQVSGARILFSSGFDSIPSDLGVMFLQKLARDRFGRPVHRVYGRVTSFKGGFSGGTLASLAAVREAAEKDPSIKVLLRNPFALTPGFSGAPQPGEEMEPTFDDILGQWTSPFVMAPINTRNVHRSNLLQGFSYGRDFQYDERIAVGPAQGGRERAEAVMHSMLPEGDDSPKQGEGPSKEEREAGSYQFLFTGMTYQGDEVQVAVHGDRDPGYGSTSKIISETAIFLEKQGQSVKAGIWTPAAALGLPLADWLERNAGLSFKAV